MNRLVFLLAAIVMTSLSLSASAADPAAGQSKAQSCVACHGADGNSSNGGFPSLAGQVPGYIAAQLAAFKSGVRANAIMQGDGPAPKRRRYGRYRCLVRVANDRSTGY